MTISFDHITLDRRDRRVEQELMNNIVRVVQRELQDFHRYHRRRRQPRIVATGDDKTDVVTEGDDIQAPIARIRVFPSMIMDDSGAMAHHEEDVPMYERLSDVAIGSERWQRLAAPIAREADINDEAVPATKESPGWILWSMSKCWNCGRPDHPVRNCPYRYDTQRVAENRGMFMELTQSPRSHGASRNLRYFPSSSKREINQYRRSVSEKHESESENFKTTLVKNGGSSNVHYDREDVSADNLSAKNGEVPACDNKAQSPTGAVVESLTAIDVGAPMVSNDITAAITDGSGDTNQHNGLECKDAAIGSALHPPNEAPLIHITEKVDSVETPVHDDTTIEDVSSNETKTVETIDSSKQSRAPMSQADKIREIYGDVNLPESILGYTSLPSQEWSNQFRSSISRLQTRTGKQRASLDTHVDEFIAVSKEREEEWDRMIIDGDQDRYHRRRRDRSREGSRERRRNRSRSIRRERDRSYERDRDRSRSRRRIEPYNTIRDHYYHDPGRPSSRIGRDLRRRSDSALFYRRSGGDHQREYSQYDRDSPPHKRRRIGG